MITVSNPKQYERKAGGPMLRFDVELRTDAGELGQKVVGNAIFGGKLYGPSTFLAKSKKYMPVVTWHAFESGVQKAVDRTSWRRDFPTVEFPPEAA
jgi:hypothetical protein